MATGAEATNTQVRGWCTVCRRTGACEHLQVPHDRAVAHLKARGVVIQIRALADASAMAERGSGLPRRSHSSESVTEHPRRAAHCTAR